MPYGIRSAPIDAWRVFDDQNPDPGYFQFDWLSARHPDLYHEFALSTVGQMQELDKLVDLSGLIVADVGAGTGRSTVPAARKARKVIAADTYRSVVTYGEKTVRAAGLDNVAYIVADGEHLPLEDNSVDAVLSAWAQLDFGEAYRVLVPNGYIIQLTSAPGSLCGELTATLQESYPELITEVAPQEYYDRSCPTSESIGAGTEWNGIPLVGPMKIHDFTYVAEYESVREASEIFGRLYGPLAKKYLHDRQQATVASRLRICYGKVKKQRSV